jgi:hypothetical protein
VGGRHGIAVHFLNLIFRHSGLLSIQFERLIVLWICVIGDLLWICVIGDLGKIAQVDRLAAIWASHEMVKVACGRPFMPVADYRPAEVT